MRYTGLLILLALILGPVTVRSEQQSPDFSGKWQINKEKSDFGQRQDGKKRIPRSSSMIIEQDDKKLAVTMIRTDRDGEENSGLLIIRISPHWNCQHLYLKEWKYA